MKEAGMNDVHALEPQYESEIAIIGMSGRFPGARDIDEFWQNLKDGVESISFFSDQEVEAAGIDPALLRHPHYVKAGGVLADVELFDAAFFGYSHREAELIDPQQRVFLECAWEALENAGYDPETYKGRIGVYAGVDMNTYLLFNLGSNPALLRSAGGFQVMITNDKDYLSTRVSYKLDLKGPSLTVQTACSTSLVAAHLAWQSLLNGECDMALAGGVSISVPQKAGYLYQEGMVYSPDGHCRAFDARAQGIVFGNGVCIVVLKRLADALADGDSIHAVIKGSAINNDGSMKVGYTAPSVDGQAEVITEAQAMAGVEPETITYIETHGTGTSLGDPIEVAALTQAFRTRTDEKNFCAIGAVKTNVGHLGAAAGVAGLIKTILALKHKMIPPSLNFEQPNPKIDFANSPFYVNTTLAEWRTDGMVRRAGVSSFGIGGTNVHMVLEEAPIVEPGGESRPWQLLVLSAKTGSALDTATANLAEYLKQHSDLDPADVAYTLQVGRQAFNYRRSLVCRDVEDAVTALESLDPARVLTHFYESAERPVAFMFPGGGAQHVNMGLELYREEPLFREQVDRCIDLLKSHLGLDLRTLLYPDLERSEEGSAQRMVQTSIALPALFTVEYALARLWMSWGVRPQAMIGHSLGEYACACLAGVFSLEDALATVALRGRLFEELPAGAMLSVPLSEEGVRFFLDTELSVAAVNGPALCVVSGPVDAVDKLEASLAERNVGSHRLKISVAAHSAMVTPVLKEFMQFLEKVHLRAPRIPYVSNVTGTWVTARDATDPGYWARHLRETVRFADGVRTLWQEPARVLLEVGPGRTLRTLAGQQAGPQGERLALCSLPHPRDRCSSIAFLLSALGQLWIAGVPVDWAGFHAHERRRRVPLPTYSFERQRYWVEPRSQARLADDRQAETEETPARADLDREVSFSSHQRPSLASAYVAPRNELERTIVEVWQEFLGIEQIGVYDNFFEVGGHSLLASQLVSQLRDIFQIELPLHELFEVLTVAGMAEVVEEALIEKIEGLSEEEAQHLV